MGSASGEIAAEQAIHPSNEPALTPQTDTVAPVIGLFIDLIVMLVRLMVWLLVLFVKLTFWLIQALVAVCVGIFAMLTRRV
ncbi:hypothetical protein [Xylanimonas protaetiae]|uniref:Uncharacterized protein n=1 Tax=Xylanimonas protaetiae TaxID=2509457 RepID=A0A4P6F2G5_9MICO|nr:hypothetical protein [Xylanimonas protaetiae]QAY69742.1 hypothetical protein ET471_06550 [Xylanimonas protaetiae]